MKKLLLSLALGTMIFCANAETTWKMGDNTFTVDTLFHATTGPGVKTTGLRLCGADDAVNTIKTNIFYSEIDLTNPNLEIRGVHAKDGGCTFESVKSMGERKTAKGNGIYIAGTNGDFFNNNDKGIPIHTNGYSMADGTMYDYATSDSWQKWATYAVVSDKKDVKIQMGINAYRTLEFPSNASHRLWIDPSGRWDNYLCIYTPAYGENTKTNKWGIECTVKLASGSIEGGDAVFEVTGAPEEGVGSMAIPADGYVLSGVGDGNPPVKALKVGDKVSLGCAVNYNGIEINPHAVIGGCSMLVMDGQVAPEQYFDKSIIPHFVSNEARTAIGYNKDRTKLIMLVVDKYATNKATDDFRKGFGGSSTGFVNRRVAQVLVNLGCYTAMNYDGGGSSQLYNHKLGVRNIPYGENSYLRPVANGIFAVSTSPVDETVASIEVMQKNVKLAKGETFTPKVYGFNKYGVLVDADVKDFTVTVAPALATVAGTTLTASDAKGATIAVVSKGDIKCGVRLLTNGGGEYVTSGDDSAPLMVGETYEADEPMGIDEESITLTERWRFVNEAYNDGWDGTAPDWTSADAIKSKSCPRFATARNGRFYTVDMKTMSIAEITPKGEIKPLYKLPALTEKYNNVDDYYGAAISSDDAGNFLIGHLFTTADTYRVWTIYSPKYNVAKHFAVDISGQQANGRIDNVGRVVGDLTKDAYVYVACKATGAFESQSALVLHFTGDYNPANVTVEHSFAEKLTMSGSGNSLSICQPKYTIDQMKGKDAKNCFYWYSKAEGNGEYSITLMGRNDDGTDSYYGTPTWGNYSGLNGFDTFTLAGKRYFVINYADEKEAATNISGQHIIVKDERGTTVAEWNNPDYVSAKGYNTITAVPVDPYNVNIYVYNCTGNFNGKGTGNGAIAGALLRISMGDADDEEPVDITPAGYKFDDYEITDEDKGAEFKLYSTETSGAWSGPAGFYHQKHPTAFEDHGHLTSIMYRGQGTDLNSQENVDAVVQPMVAVRKLDEHIGQALVINQQWSPLANMNATWPNSGFKGAQPQFSFFAQNEAVKANTDRRHYIRVRLVYNVLKRGCHHVQDLEKTPGNVNAVRSIYATHENNWVIPGKDEETGARYAETGMTFAQFEGETGKPQDLAENPVVRTPEEGEIDPYDAAHGGVTDSHANGRPTYIMNGERFRVYEFDTYMDTPERTSLSVQFNITDRNTNYIIKEIKFTDLGTDEAAAYLLGRRQLGWKYYNEYASGIEDVVTDEADYSDAPAVYYNLQGVQVKNPANGIYIMRQGNKATKVYVK